MRCFKGEFAYHKVTWNHNFPDWKYIEEKTGRIMETTYRECRIEFLEQKRFPTTKKGKYNASVKNVVQINIKSFEEIPINHTPIKHKTEIM